ncbi:hypothetical protein J6590_005772 [Homalodisca vitripennis]|nr:hypothetical protein J6590_005772 [Homalodisca vitripennis]
MRGGDWLEACQHSFIQSLRADTCNAPHIGRQSKSNKRKTPNRKTEGHDLTPVGAAFPTCSNRREIWKEAKITQQRSDSSGDNKGSLARNSMSGADSHELFTCQNTAK